VTLPIFRLATFSLPSPEARRADGSATALAPVALLAASEGATPGTRFSSSGVKQRRGRPCRRVKARRPGSLPFLSIVPTAERERKERPASERVLLTASSISRASV